MKYAKEGSAAKNTALIVIAALAAVAVIAAAIIMLLPDSDGGKETGTSAETTAESVISEETETAAATDETEAPADTTVTPPETSEPVTDPAVTDPPPSVSTVPSTEYVQPADRDTDFSGCLFIGDSRTEGLMLYSGIRGATAYTARGLMVDTYFTSPAVNMNGTKVTVSEAVEVNTGFDRVYIMLGVNELGWPYESVFGDCYGKLIDHVKSAMPDAEINVQSIIPVTATKSASDGIYNNENIRRFNEVIKQMCAEKGVNYVDLIPELCGGYDSLPEEAAFDGIHLQMAYCKRWLDCLKNKM